MSVGILAFESDSLLEQDNTYFLDDPGLGGPGGAFGSSPAPEGEPGIQAETILL